MGIEKGKKVYLGDSVYCEFDGFHVVIYTDNGCEPTNMIYLEDTVAVALTNFIKKAFGDPSEGRG